MIYEKKTEELYHFGILGMKWGIRRFQNPDGTLTAAGKRRYKKDPKFAEKYDHQMAERSKPIKQKVKEFVTNENTIIVGATFAAAAIAAYGSYKLYDKDADNFFKYAMKADEFLGKIEKYGIPAAGIASSLVIARRVLKSKNWNDPAVNEDLRTINRALGSVY